jgi:hypothetical protein
MRKGTTVALGARDAVAHDAPRDPKEPSVKTRALAVLALPMLLVLAACGDDPSSISDPTPTPVANVPNVQGTWSANWLVQFVRAEDGYTGSWNCPGSFTLTQTSAGGAAGALSGFGSVTGNCPPMSFDVRGSVQSNGAIVFTTGGPKSGAGPCPAPPETMNYSGLVQNNSISVRATNTLQCGSEGPYRFEFILTGSKRS